MNDITRRQALLSALFGSGYVGLRALATGIPISVLLNPKRAMAMGADAAPADPTAQFLVVSTSGSGDPLNGNVPGTYDDPGIVHPTDGNFQAANISQSGTVRKGAAAWGGLGQNLLDQTVFFHHATYTIQHSDEQRTLMLGGTVQQNDMLAAALAQKLGPRLNTVQNVPMNIGKETISAEGRILPTLQPKSLAAVLTLPNGPLSKLQALRDQTLDSLNQYYHRNATAGQRNFLDRYATSQAQLRETAGDLLAQLNNIKDNSAASQMLAATAIVQMKLAPVVVVSLDFGGDNHNDQNLAGEAAAHMSSISAINGLYGNLAKVNLDSQVSFMALNVFGRTMTPRGDSPLRGRDHNDTHHATVMISSALKGGVVGGVKMGGNGEYTARGIDSRSGMAADGGDIGFGDTFASMGKTVGRAVGVSSADVDTIVSGGTAVNGVLKNP